MFPCESVAAAAAGDSQSPPATSRRFALGFLFALLSTVVSAAGIDIASAVVRPQSDGPTAYTKAITVNSTTTTRLRYSSTSTHAFGICTVDTAGLNVYVVDSTATATTDGQGPYCDTCTNGPGFVIGQDYARTSSGSGTVRCRFYDAPIGAGVDAGGFTRGIADTLYCKLVGCTMTGPIRGPDGNSGAGSFSFASQTNMGMFRIASGRLGLSANGATDLDVNGSTLTINTPDALQFNGVTNDITTNTGEDLRLAPGGSVVLRDGDNNIDVEDSAGVVKGQISTNASASTLRVSQNLTSGAAVRYTTSFVLSGRIDDANTTTAVQCVADGIDTAGGGNCIGSEWFGDGLEAQPSPQTTSATCAAGVLALDPKSSVVIVDGNAATCTVTLTSSGNVGTINLESKPIRISAKNVGAATLKIAATNFATIPTRCSSTGMTAGQSALVAWDKDQSKWTFLGGCE